MVSAIDALIVVNAVNSGEVQDIDVVFALADINSDGEVLESDTTQIVSYVERIHRFGSNSWSRRMRSDSV